MATRAMKEQLLRKLIEQHMSFLLRQKHSYIGCPRPFQREELPLMPILNKEIETARELLRDLDSVSPIIGNPFKQLLK